MFCFKRFLIFVTFVGVISATDTTPVPQLQNQTEIQPEIQNQTEALPEIKIPLAKINVTKNVHWWDCGGPNATVRWEDFQAENPIRIETLEIGAKYRILEEVKPGSYSRVEVWRVINLIIAPVYVKIPCIGKFGSCNYDICRIMDKDNFCSFQRQNNAGCGCPMAPKVVEGYQYKARIPKTKFSTFSQLYANVI